MIITKLDSTEIMKNVHKVDVRNLYNSKNAMISIITLKPGERLKRHITPVDVVFFCSLRDRCC